MFASCYDTRERRTDDRTCGAEPVESAVAWQTIGIVRGRELRRQCVLSGDRGAGRKSRHGYTALIKEVPEPER